MKTLTWLPRVLWAALKGDTETLFGHKKKSENPIGAGKTRPVVNPPTWPDGKTNPQPLKW